MTGFAHFGDFCPNKACPDHGKLQTEGQRTIKKAGKTKIGRQRYQCKTCGQTFTETKGTIFYRRRTPEHEIIETLAFIAEGVRVSSLARVKGHKEDPVLAWLRGAAQHTEAIEEILMAEYQLDRGQLDALWSYVGNKGEKNTTARPTKAVSSLAFRQDRLARHNDRHRHATASGTRCRQDRNRGCDGGVPNSEAARAP